MCPTTNILKGNIMIRVFATYILGAAVMATSYIAYMNGSYILVLLSGLLIAASTGWVWMVGESVKTDRYLANKEREEFWQYTERMRIEEETS